MTRTYDASASVQLPERISQLIERGCRVTPLYWVLDNGACTCTDTECPTPGKHPIHEDWPERATCDRKQVEAWFRRSPKCNWGWVMGNEFVTIDLDTKRGKDGVASLKALEDKHGKLPRTCIATTAGGGHHLVLRNPNGARIATKINWLDGIDILAGNAQIVVEPSTTADGAYKFDRFGEPDPIPDWLLATLPKEDDEAKASADFNLDVNAELPERACQLLEDEPGGWFASTFNHDTTKPDGKDDSDSAWDYNVLREYLCRFPDADNQELADLLCAHRASEHGGGWAKRPKPKQRTRYAAVTIAAVRKRAVGPETQQPEPDARAQEPPPGVPWQTFAQIAEDTPAEVDWLWRDYLARGTVCELDAKLKAGKSTLVGHLIRSILTGQPFLDRETQSGPVVYLTEEGNRTFRSLLARAGLTGHHDGHVLSKRRVPGLEWEQLVALAKAKVVEVGACLLVVDTLSKLAGFKDDQENVSGVAMAAMTPLQALASELNIVVLVVRHDRRAGGEVGDSARGSSAFGGDADVILQLSRVGGKGREKRRYLRAIGRFDETPAEIIIELAEDGYRVVPETDACAAAVKALLEIVPEGEDDAVIVTEVVLPELAKLDVSRTYAYQGIRQLVAEKRMGKGKRESQDLDKQGRRRKKDAIWLVVPETASNGGT